MQNLQALENIFRNLMNVDRVVIPGVDNGLDSVDNDDLGQLSSWFVED